MANPRECIASVVSCLSRMQQLCVVVHEWSPLGLVRLGLGEQRWRWKTWKVSGTVGAAAESWHGALDRVFAKCNEEPFLYITVKLVAP